MNYQEFNPASPSTPLHRQLHPKAALPPATDHAPPHTIDFRSSDQTLDRYQEIISVAGWKLDNYRKNPIVQNAHSYSSLSDTIGKSLITEVRGGMSSHESPSHAPYLFQRIQFAVEENPMAKVAYGLYKGGFLNAVSVGFIPLRWEDSPPASASHAEAGGEGGPSIRRKYLAQELVEVSAVSIPANPNALALGLKAGAIEISDLRDLADLLHHFCAESNAHVGRLPPVGAPPSLLNGEGGPVRSEIGNTDTIASKLAHLTKQMNEIRAILKRA